MNQIFDAYAHYYDLLYYDKDYGAEVDYIISQIHRYMPGAKTILELGCGTGAHAEHLVRMGFTVVGIDTSGTMLKRAEQRRAGLPQELANRLTFIQADIRNARLDSRFDVVISLFHVMSYQVTNADLKSSFTTAAHHLNDNGIFLFDFWYGPAVLTQQPVVRVKRFQSENIAVTRIAEPDVGFNTNVVNVNYTIFVENKLSKSVEQFHELHSMRYLFLPELTHFHDSYFQELKSCSWMEDKDLDSQSWSGLQILSAISR